MDHARSVPDCCARRDHSVFGFLACRQNEAAPAPSRAALSPPCLSTAPHRCAGVPLWFDPLEGVLPCTLPLTVGCPYWVNGLSFRGEMPRRSALRRRSGIGAIEPWTVGGISRAYRCRRDTPTGSDTGRICEWVGADWWSVAAPWPRTQYPAPPAGTCAVYSTARHATYVRPRGLEPRTP